MTRLLGTGQLARRLPDGGVELVGAVDGARLRGLRIDTEKIRSALRRCPSVQDVTVALEPPDDPDGRLVARITPTSRPPTLDGLRAALWSRLPGYAWPSGAAGVRVPGSSEQSILTALWAGLLGLEPRAGREPLAGVLVPGRARPRSRRGVRGADPQRDGQPDARDARRRRGRREGVARPSARLAAGSTRWFVAKAECL